MLPAIENAMAGFCDAGINLDDRPKSIFATLRVIRAFRLLKLVRLVKTPFALVKRLVLRIATPRATVTIISLLIECLVSSHIFACLLGMMSTFATSPLDTWSATHGYCRPDPTNRTLGNCSLCDDPSCHECRPDADCVDGPALYLQCLWWSVGMLMGAPISMSPDKGPYERYYSQGVEIKLRSHEQIIVLCLKFIVSFHWSTVIARFVFVFNNLDSEQKEFQLGWDALNGFCSFFKIETTMAIQLRQYYMERNKEMRARSRRKVLSKFSPYLAEEVVWELDKKWLVRVPCFSLVAERLSGEELRFFVKVALSMDVSVFVPKDRPLPRKLYLITQGVALYKGEQLGIGQSWGAEDVLLRDRKNDARLRAFAMTYLHVQWLDAEVLEHLKGEFPRAHLLCRFWTMMHAVGDFLIDNLRRSKQNPVVLPAAELEERLNAKQLHVDGPLDDTNVDGEPLYVLCSRYVSQGRYEIVASGEKGHYRVIDRHGTGPKVAEITDASNIEVVMRRPPSSAGGALYQVVEKNGSVGWGDSGSVGGDSGVVATLSA